MLPPLLLLSLDLLFVYGLRSFFLHWFVLFPMLSRTVESHVWLTHTTSATTAAAMTAPVTLLLVLLWGSSGAASVGEG